jgi:hypothetical protein
MTTLTEDFAKKAYKPKYFLGDRVFGYQLNKIPFVGTVGNDRSLVGGDPNPEVIVHLDLPMRLPSGYTSTIIVKHKQIKCKMRVVEE